MAKEDLIEMSGQVLEVLPDARYRVKLDIVHGLYMACIWSVYGLYMVCIIWLVYGSYIVCIWLVYALFVLMLPASVEASVTRNSKPWEG